MSIATMTRGLALTVCLALAATGCDRAREQPPASVVGVKIYDTDRDLPGLFEEWGDLGITTVFASRELAAREGFGDLAARSGIGVFVIFPVLFAPAELAADPGLWAITADGERAKDDWVEFACPSRPAFRAQRVAEAREVVRDLHPDGLSVDFIRHFVFWEMVAPDRDPATLPDTCYCPTCLAGFAEYAGLDPTAIPSAPREAAAWVRANATEAWTRFKCDTITSLAAEVAAGAREVDPGIRVNLHLVPWRTGDFGGAVTRVAGQDRPRLGAIVDSLSPMCYSFMLHREPGWIASVVRDVAGAASAPVLPSIQVATAYREGGVFSAAEFEACLRAALAPPSAGVVFWSWDHIAADPEKADVIRRVVGESR